MFFSSLFGPTMEKVAGIWRRLHNEDDRVEMGDVYGHVARRGQMRNAFNVLVRNSDEKGPHG
jgi:hypothetical protein